MRITLSPPQNINIDLGSPISNIKSISTIDIVRHRETLDDVYSAKITFNETEERELFLFEGAEYNGTSKNSDGGYDEGVIVIVGNKFPTEQEIIDRVKLIYSII